MINKFLEQTNILIFTGYCIGKGHNLKELKDNGDTDIIAKLYDEFINKMKEMENEK